MKVLGRENIVQQHLFRLNFYFVRSALFLPLFHVKYHIVSPLRPCIISTQRFAFSTFNVYNIEEELFSPNSQHIYSAQSIVL